MLSNLNAGTLASLEDDEEVSTTTSSDPPTTLRSLSFYSQSQEVLINELSKEDPECPLVGLQQNHRWVKFWKEAWDRNLDSFDGTKRVKRDEDGVIDDSPISDVVPTKCNAMVKPRTLEKCWKFNCKNVFIRAEYQEAEDFALSICGSEAPEYGALVVTGQPGIGLSPLLLSD